MLAAVFFLVSAHFYLRLLMHLLRREHEAGVVRTHRVVYLNALLYKLLHCFHVGAAQYWTLRI